MYPLLLQRLVISNSSLHLPQRKQRCLSYWYVSLCLFSLAPSLPFFLSFSLSFSSFSLSMLMIHQVYIEDPTMIPFMLNTTASSFDSLHYVLLESFPQYKQKQFGIDSIRIYLQIPSPFKIFFCFVSDLIFYLHFFKIFNLFCLIFCLFDSTYILVCGLINGASLSSLHRTGTSFPVKPKSL